MSDYTDAKMRVLACLKAAAPKSLTTWEIIHLAHHSRAVGRVWDLIQAGYQIDHTQDGRVHRWTYRGEPKPLPLFERSA